VTRFRHVNNVGASYRGLWSSTPFLSKPPYIYANGHSTITALIVIRLLCLTVQRVTNSRMWKHGCSSSLFRTSSSDTDCILTFSLGLFFPTLRRFYFCRLRSTIWYDMYVGLCIMYEMLTLNITPNDKAWAFKELGPPNPLLGRISSRSHFFTLLPFEYPHAPIATTFRRHWFEVYIELQR